MNNKNTYIDNNIVVVVGKIRTELTNFKFRIESNETVNITTRAGVATYISKEGQDSLINRAEQAMYLSKQNGRNRITVAEQ